VAALAQHDQIAWLGGPTLGGRDYVVHLESLVGATEEASAIAGKDLLAGPCSSGLVPGTV
jgi:hypothetical protein